MKLHKNQQLFQDAVIATSQKFNIPEIYIEKDYWVTLALFAIFHSSVAEEAVFKGGTALSKCYKLIDRFSEDVDIVVLNDKSESGNQLKNKLKAISSVVSESISEIEIEGITNKRGMIRKTVHEYPKQSFNGLFGQVREHIIVEATWLGSSEPYSTGIVSSYIGEMMKENGQEKIIQENNMQPFQVNVLGKERTLCEKVMSLVRFSHTISPYSDLANKIRHIYDLHLMLKDKEVVFFFENREFEKLLIIVGRDDRISFKNNNDWLNEHPSDAIIFKDPDKTWEMIKNTYRTTFKELVMGELPVESDLIGTLKKIYYRMEKIEWNL